MATAMVRASALLGPASYNATDHTIEWVLNTGQVMPSYGFSVRPEGMKDAAYMPVRDGHDWIFGADGSIVERTLGRIVSTRLDKRRGRVGLIKFSQENPRGVLAEAMVAAGDLGAGSVEILPEKILKKGDEEPLSLEEAGYLGKGDVIFESSLDAFAIVGVPGDPGALSLSAERYHLPQVHEYVAKRQEAGERIEHPTLLHVLATVKGLEKQIVALTALIEGKEQELVTHSTAEADSATGSAGLTAVEWLASGFK